MYISCIFQLDLRKLDPQSAAQGQQGISTFLHSLGIQLRIQQADLAILTSEGLAVRMSHAMPCLGSAIFGCAQSRWHLHAFKYWHTIMQRSLVLEALGVWTEIFWQRMGNKHSDLQKPSSAKVNSAVINLAVCSVSLGWNCGLEGRTLQSLTIGHQAPRCNSSFPQEKTTFTHFCNSSPLFLSRLLHWCASVGMELEQKHPSPSCHLHRYTSLATETAKCVFKSVSQVCRFCWPHVSIHWPNGKTQVVPFLCQLFSPASKDGDSTLTSLTNQAKCAPLRTLDAKKSFLVSKVLVFRKSGVLYAWACRI